MHRGSSVCLFPSLKVLQFFLRHYGKINLNYLVIIFSMFEDQYKNRKGSLKQQCQPTHLHLASPRFVWCNHGESIRAERQKELDWD